MKLTVLLKEAMVIIHSQLNYTQLPTGHPPRLSIEKLRLRPEHKTACRQRRYRPLPSAFIVPLPLSTRLHRLIGKAQFMTCSFLIRKVKPLYQA